MKMLSLVLLGMLALGVHRTQAQPMGIYLKVKVDLTLQQQALWGTNQNGDGKTYISTINKMKVNNKEFLNLLAEMFGTTWPDGAQLRYDIGFAQLVVTDKTGTNVLFYCEDGVDNPGRLAYVTLSWYNQPGPISGKLVEGVPGSVKFTSNYEGTIEIYYDNFSDDSVYINLGGAGLNVEKISDKTTDTTETRSWKETFTPFGIGSFDDDNAIITGRITANGKVKGPVK
jgi:hypothetical protein